MPMQIDLDADYTNLVIWKYGRRADLWLSGQAELGRFLKKYRIKALPRASYPYDATPMLREVPTAKVIKQMRVEALWPRPFPGGIRTPHVHFGGELYILNSKQWDKYAAMVMDDAQKRISKASKVDFEQLIEISEAVGRL